MSNERYWKVEWSMGYSGTDETEIVDLIEDWGWTKEQLNDCPTKTIRKELDDYAWQQATANISSGYSPATEDDIEDYS